MSLIDSQPKCAFCQWNVDMCFNGGYSKEYPGVKDGFHYYEKQIRDCDGKHLHPFCAWRLMERERSVRDHDPGMPLLLTQFKIVRNEDTIFSFRCPERNYHYYMAEDESEEGTTDDESEEEVHFRDWEGTSYGDKTIGDARLIKN